MSAWIIPIVTHWVVLSIGFAAGAVWCGMMRRHRDQEERDDRALQVMGSEYFDPEDHADLLRKVRH